jgi:hypothetical protein
MWLWTAKAPCHVLTRCILRPFGSTEYVDKFWDLARTEMYGLPYNLCFGRFAHRLRDGMGLRNTFGILMSALTLHGVEYFIFTMDL